MKLFTNIFICLCIALATNAMNINLAFAEDTGTTISGDTISSAPFDPDTTKEPDVNNPGTNESNTN